MWELFEIEMMIGFLAKSAIAVNGERIYLYGALDGISIALYIKTNRQSLPKAFNRKDVVD